MDNSLNKFYSLRSRMKIAKTRVINHIIKLCYDCKSENELMELKSLYKQLKERKVFDNKDMDTYWYNNFKILVGE